MEDNKVKEGTVLDLTEDNITVPDEKFNPETTLRADLWPKLSLNDLWLQKILLQQRINIANNIGNVGLKEQLERGMKFLQVHIDEKNKNIETPSVFL